MKVFKFGGASVKNADAVKNVGEVLNLYRSDDLVVVVSAMGKTTNSLERLTDEYYNKTGDASKSFETIRSYHIDIVKELFPDENHSVYAEVNNLFVELEWIIEDEPAGDYDFVYDQVVSTGELISTVIVSFWLNEAGIKNTWVDVRDFLKTDNTYREAKVDWALTEKKINKVLIPLFSQHKGGTVAVTQGFIGVTSENYNTTLGREGSDYTAAIIASLMNVEEVVIWKDVPGVLNADPKWFDNTVKLDTLSYHEAIELSFFGATVIHPKTLKPLENKQIPLKVKSFSAPAEEGTLIGSRDRVHPVSTASVSTAQTLIPSFIFKMDQVLISILPKDYSFIVEENLSSIFKSFADHGVKINLMQHAALSFSVCMNGDKQKIPRLIAALQKNYRVLYNENTELVTIRHYNQLTIDRLIKGKKIFIEQKSRQTARFVMQ